LNGDAGGPCGIAFILTGEVDLPKDELDGADEEDDETDSVVGFDFG
jgi:hypothetical protein